MIVNFAFGASWFLLYLGISWHTNWKYSFLMKRL